jgi:RNA polymerase sigma-70 factor, ECF subfamily
MNPRRIGGHRVEMADSAMTAGALERDLLDAARGGDQDAYRRLVEPHRGALHAHCYRMLGSVHDAEDALQDALLRAWRGLPRFEGRSSLRSWLYTIATNASLNAIERRPRRMLPIDLGPPADPHDTPGAPLVESTWVEPYPDERLGLVDGRAAPEARYERREGVELAFVAAIQHLPPNQRAALILRDVLGFSSQEVADTLDTTTAAVNSALQRARRTVEERLPERSQQATLRALGDERLNAIVEAYMDAMSRGDVDAVVSLLAEDAVWSMPPLGSWYRGAGAIAIFLATAPLNGRWRWRHLPARASGQPAVGAYVLGADGAYRAFALDVLTLRGDRIEAITSFIDRTLALRDGDDFSVWPEYPADPGRAAAYFSVFGLPERLD